jgi:hypothetical protein
LGLGLGMDLRFDKKMDAGDMRKDDFWN